MAVARAVTIASLFAVSLFGLAGPANASPAFPPSFPMSGLKPDNWGMTIRQGSTKLRRNYAGIASVSCMGVRMRGYPRSSSTWVIRGRRYWDKLWCSGTTQTGKVFTLVHDAKSRTRSVIYRLVNVTKEELRGGGAQPQPQPQPQPQAFDWLIQKAYESAVARGSDAEPTAVSRFYWYDVNDCRMVDGATARCTLWRWKETLTDYWLVAGVLREIYRTFHFAILHDTSGVYTLAVQGTAEPPYQIICSDANKGSIVVHVDPLTGQPAPFCT
jgi:hypothetical protein